MLGVAHPAEYVLFAGGGGAVVDVADAVDYAGDVVGVAALVGSEGDGGYVGDCYHDYNIILCLCEKNNIILRD